MIAPVRWRTYERWARASMPKTWIEPEFGRTRPSTEPIRVDLPAPLGPSNPQTSPGNTWRSSPARAVTAPKRFTRPFTSSTGFDYGEIASVVIRWPYF